MLFDRRFERPGALRDLLAEGGDVLLEALPRGALGEQLGVQPIALGLQMLRLGTRRPTAAAPR